MKSNYLLIYFILFSIFGFSQNYDIGGIVKEATSGLPLPAVSIQIKNTSKGTISDLDGKFLLKDVALGTTIVFSYIGFKTFEYKVISENNNLSIALLDDTRNLDEIVLIGYGSQKKKEVTGAVSVINSKTLDNLKPIDATLALQGTAAGVVVNSQGGSPGASYNIRIRGISTNGVNGPRIFLDGNDIGTDMNLLNPNDIESITILKDAQAAIYGVIGANGIVLVTTKKGKKDSLAKISYNGYTGFQETSRKLPLLNATEYALLLNESYANGGLSLPFPNVNGLGIGTDWQNEIFTKGAPILSHDLTVSGGGEKITYAVSASDLTQEGIIGKEKSHYKRNTARISLSADVTKKLKLQTNFIYTYVDRDAFNDNGLGSVLFNAINAPSTLNPYNVNGEFSLVPSTPGLGIEIINPLAQLSNTYNDYDLKKINGSFGLDYEIIKDLIITSRIGINNANSKGKSFAKQVDYGPGKVFNVTRSSVSQNAVNDISYTFDAYLTYKKIFLENHNVTATLGNSIYREYGNGLFATGFDVPQNSWDFADIQVALGTSTGRDVGSYNYNDKRLSYFGRLQYSFKGKYLLSGILRRDASTRFGPNNSVAYFPSFTAGWLISDENFFGSNRIINFMKLRASYGNLGNDQIPPYGYVGNLSGEATYVFDNTLVNGTAIGGLPNPNLKWETSKKLDIGLDINLFDNKLEITTDYYLNNTRDLLIGFLPVTGISGIAAPGSAPPTINAGSTRNKGLELSMNYNNQINKNLKFGINYNVTTINNEVTEILGQRKFIESGGFGVGQNFLPSRMEVGKPIGYFYGFQTDGIFQNQTEVNAHPSQLSLGAEASPGDIRFKDLNGDGVIDPNDRTNLGDPIPDFTMGLNLNFTYKNIDFIAYSFASIGNDMVRNYERTLTDANRLNYVLQRWTGEGTSNSVPRVTTDATSNNVFSSYFVEDASFLRIQNVQLGYTVNPDFSKRSGISKLRFYASVNNLYTFTKYKGFDPAASTGAPIGGGIDNGFYPIAKTYIFGININF